MLRDEKYKMILRYGRVHKLKSLSFITFLLDWLHAGGLPATISIALISSRVQCITPRKKTHTPIYFIYKTHKNNRCNFYWLIFNWHWPFFFNIITPCFYVGNFINFWSIWLKTQRDSNFLRPTLWFINISFVTF